jgi:glycosyltransferase involved in cell wall biosynthesis
MSDEARSISVVIPLYNCVDRIEGAILSALNQVPEPVEIIVVDDASTDQIDAAALTAIDPRVRVIRHEVNRGGGVARNTGIDAANGQLIAFLDADDRWLPGKLERQLSQIWDLRFENVFACANVRLEGPSPKKVIYNSRPPYEGEDISRYFLIHDCTFQTSTLVVPAKLAKSVRFDDRLRRHQDWDFIFRLIRNGARYLYCDEPLAVYWDGDNPKRVSTQKSIEPALFWLSVTGDSVAPDAAAVFYFRTTFRRHFAQQPLAAFLTAVRMGLSDQRALAWVLRKLSPFTIAN